MSEDRQGTPSRPYHPHIRTLRNKFTLAMSSRGFQPCTLPELIRLTLPSKTTTTGPVRAEACVYRCLTCDDSLVPCPSLFPFSSCLRLCPRKSPPVAGVFLMQGSECGTTFRLVPADGMWSVSVGSVGIMCARAGQGGTLIVQLTSVPTEIPGR